MRSYQIVADVDAEKRSAARQAGAHETIDNGEDGAVSRILKMTGGGVAAAIDFVGVPATTRFGIDVLRKGGKVPPIPVEPRPISQANRTLDNLREGRVLGRVVLTP